jgi:hypothetical protein
METTASRLIAYRRELVAGDINPMVADEMVRDLARHFVETRGLVVLNDDQKTPTPPSA